jgi:DNA-binding transcriptional ArsR family regulator
MPNCIDLIAVPSWDELDTMTEAANLVEVAALVGDTARATVLAALMGGRAMTSGELAAVANVNKSTMSEHLAKLEAANLVSVAADGRFKYYRIASPRIAAMMESMLAVAAIDTPQRYRPRSAEDAALRSARTCYDHLAGTLGVRLADAMIAAGHIELAADGGEVTGAGLRFLRSIGADPCTVGSKKRVFCRPCLDWSERRYHVAGLVGAALCHMCFERKWVKRIHGTRAIVVTNIGRRGFQDHFKFDATSVS